jgi:hypothetical protein
MWCRGLVAGMLLAATVGGARSSIRSIRATTRSTGLYCVPENGSADTKRIFALLSQLIALKTSAADPAITSAVRVVQ